jgi:hypothetical protein
MMHLLRKDEMNMVKEYVSYRGWREADEESDPEQDRFVAKLDYDALGADKAELLRVLGVADERIKALEALNSRLANDINCGELLPQSETPAARECNCNWDPPHAPLCPAFTAETSEPDQAPIARLYVDNDGMAKAALYAPGLPAGQFDVYLESTAETGVKFGTPTPICEPPCPAHLCAALSAVGMCGIDHWEAQNPPSTADSRSTFTPCIHGVDPEQCDACYTSSAKIYAKGSRLPLNTEPRRHVGWCTECGCGKNDPDGAVVFAHLDHCSKFDRGAAK